MLRIFSLPSFPQVLLPIKKIELFINSLSCNKCCENLISKLGMAGRIIKLAIIFLITSVFIVIVSIFVKNILIFHEKLKTKVSEVNIVKVEGELYESSLFAIGAVDIRTIQTLPMVDICECSRRSKYNSSDIHSCQFLEFTGELLLGNLTTDERTRRTVNIMVVESPGNFAIREYVNITCWSRFAIRFILLNALINPCVGHLITGRNALP